MGKIRDKKIAQEISELKQYPLFRGAPRGFFEILLLYIKPVIFKGGDTIVDFG